VEVNLVLVRDQDGQPQYLQGVIRDITERVQAEEEQSWLMEELRHSAEELRQLTYRLQEVQESERRQLAAELHDSVGQNLTGLSLNLKIIDVQLRPDASSQLHRRLDDSLGLLEQTTRQVRDVLSELRSPLLEQYGLFAAVNWYAQQFSERSGIQVTVQGQEFTPRLPLPTETILFRLVQEAMNNVLKHAHAARATIHLESDAESGRITVEDDGKGFEPSAQSRPGEVPSWGRLTMQQRALSLGGDLTIDSSPGGGTRVSVRFAR
jgi:signal transduction histidine kinase